MRSVEILDDVEVNGHRLLAFDLKDILDLFQDKALQSDWQLSRVECTGEPACRDLEQFSDKSVIVPGRTLVDIARNVVQVVNGCFSGIIRGESTPWIRIDALDSTSFCVTTADDEIVALLKRSFKKVRDVPE
jgi:hypothetical protein